MTLESTKFIGNQNLHTISPIQSNFESAYIKVRDLENRVYSDSEVEQLPHSIKQKSEWKLRAKSAKRFENYLTETHSQSNLLEIGCGNGWYSHLCSKHLKSVCGVDLNLTELEQASRVFKKDKLNFYYWNLFTKSPFKKDFDIIVLNAVVQYFPDFNILFSRLKELLNTKGEIHIIDSPFYAAIEIAAAQKRTQDYYAKMAVPEMSNFYFHHDKKELKDFEVLYAPNKFRQILSGKDSPFTWYRFKS